MTKSSNVKSIRVNQEISKKPPAIDFDLKAVNLQEVIQMGLQSFMLEVGMIAVQQAMAAEVVSLAGPRYARGTGNNAQRWGNQQGLVYVNGQKVNIKKPRVVRKSANKHEEVDLKTYKEFSKPNAMNEAIMAKMLAGVSTRDYAGTSMDTALAAVPLAVEQSKNQASSSRTSTRADLTSRNSS
jgi:hypothetical protein